MTNENIHEDGESTNFSHNIDVILKKYDYSRLKAYCFDKENHQEVYEDGWSLLSQLIKHLKEEKVDDNELEKFQEIFMHIANTSKPKELLLGVLEQFDPMVELSIVKLLFPALTTVCKLVVEQSKQFHCYNLSMTFSTLLYYAESLNLPKYNDFDPMENIPEVLEEIKISRFVENCVELGIALMFDFLKLFQEEKVHENHLKAVKSEFMNFCSGLLERLSYIDVEEIKASHQFEKPICKDCSKNPECSSEIEPDKPVKREKQTLGAASKICGLVRLVHSPWTLLHDATWRNLCRNDRKFTGEELERIGRSRACFLHLTFIKDMQVQHVPQILHPEFVFICCIPSVLVLWKNPQPMLVHKGLELCRFATNRLAPLTLRCGYLSHALKQAEVTQPSRGLLDGAVEIATHCPSRTLRQRAAQFLKKFLDKFVWMDRYNLLYYLLTSQSHSGILGYLIGYFKDKLAEILQVKVPPNSEYFLDELRIKKMLDTCLVLRDGSETDLLSEYDRIMASLNLLIFLFIRDSTNKTYIWNRVDVVQKTYINPLRTGINLSRMHFRDELSKQSDPKRMKEDTAKTDFYINGISLPTLPPADRKKALMSAIHSFDMMEGVVVRVQQLIDDKSLSEKHR